MINTCNIDNWLAFLAIQGKVTEAISATIIHPLTKLIIESCREGKFITSKYMLAELNNIKHENMIIDFDGNEEVHFIQHIKHLYINKLKTTCSSPFCPMPSREVILKDVPSFPLPHIPYQHSKSLKRKL